MAAYRNPTVGELFRELLLRVRMASGRTAWDPPPTPLTGARAELYVAAKSAHSEDDRLTAYVGRLATCLNVGSGLPSAPRRPDIERALYRLIRDDMSDADAARYLGELRGDT
jgi:hypothetical protein